jgi:hypothetical protein
MYSNSEAIIRPDLQAVIEEAAAADTYFIGQRVLPVKFSKRRTGEYHRITRAKSGLLLSELGDSTRRAPKSSYKKVDRTYDKANFVALDRGLEEQIDDADAAEVAPSFSAEETSARLTLRDMQIAQEKRVAETFINTATFTATAATAAYTEANIATFDFANDIEEAIAKVQKRGEMVNAIILSRNIWKRIRRSTLLRKYLFGDNGGNQMITADLLAKAFSESAQLKIFIAEASYDTEATKASVDGAQYIWPDTHVWVGAIWDGADSSAPGDAEDGSATAIRLPGGVGATLVWEQMANSLFVPSTYRDEVHVSDVVRVTQFSCEKVFNAACGTLITTNYV